MKRFVSHFFTVLGFMLMVTSCQKAPFVTLNTPKSFSFTRDGGTQNISFTCNRDWSVSSSESWIQVSPSSGTASDGEVTVKITCAANTTYDPRSATITVKVEELTEAISISQDTGIGLLVSPTVFNLSEWPQDIEVDVQANIEYTIEIDESSQGWIEIKETKALASSKQVFHIDWNFATENRQGKVFFCRKDGDKAEIVINQKQWDVLYTSNTNYVVSHDNQEIVIESIANVEFDVSSDASWVHYINTKSAAEKYTTLSIDTNESHEKRTCLVSFRQVNGNLSFDVSITQKGFPIDLSSQGTSNCYIVQPRDSVFSFKADVKGNSISTDDNRLFGGKKAIVVWSVSDQWYNSNDKIIEDLQYDVDNHQIVFSATRRRGNVLIALVNENNEILWSWHIWITEYEPENGYITFSNGTILQDRYLGAFWLTRKVPCFID